jgi:hypothetical protein
MPGNARWRAAVEQVCGLLAQTAREMQEYHDERSERWQETPQAADLLERIENLEDIGAQLHEVAIQA